MPVLIRTRPGSIEIDRAAVSPDHEIVPAHFRHYLQREPDLPAITVTVRDGRAFVTSGLEVLTAALELGRESIRAVIASGTPQSDIDRLLTSPDVIQLAWTDDVSKSYATNAGWFVFYLAPGFEPAQAQDLYETIVASIRGPKLDQVDRTEHPTWDAASGLVEFEVATPNDESWYTDLLRAIGQFHRTRVPIVSFQGRRWTD